MTTLLLIRHGENDFLKKNLLPGHLPGIHLNETGRKQAEALAAALKDLPISALYASPLERAIETAEPLAHARELEIRLEAGLMDTNVGEWAGRSWKTLRRLKVWKNVQETPSQFQFPGGESFVDLQIRIVTVLDRIVATHQEDKLVAVVFHADPIKLAVAHYLGLPLDNFQRLSISPGSVTVLQMGSSGARLAALNLIPPFSFPNL